MTIDDGGNGKLVATQHLTVHPIDRSIPTVRALAAEREAIQKDIDAREWLLTNLALKTKAILESEDKP